MLSLNKLYVQYNIIGGCVSIFNQLESFKKTSETLKEAQKAKSNYSKLTETFIFIFSYIVMIWLLALFTLMMVNGVPENGDSYVLLTLASFIVAIIITLFIVTKIEKRNLRSVGFTRDNIMSSLLKGFILGLGMIILVTVVGVLSGQYSFTGFDFSSLYLAIPYFILFTIQSFAEEIYTRGWIIPLFSKNYSVLTAIVVSSLFFTVGHVGNGGFNVIAMLNCVLFGIFFSILLLRADNIWICGAVHTSWNYAQGYLLGFNVSGLNISSIMNFDHIHPNIINGGIFGPESGLIATVVVVLALIFILKFDINKNLF